MANVLAVVFDVKGEAYQALSELKSFRQGNDTQITQIALVKNKGGKITIKDSIDFDDAGRDYATVGGTTGGLLGILGGPVGVITGYGISSLTGVASGSVANTSDNSLAEEVITKLLDGDVVAIAPVHGEDENILNHVFAPYETNIMCQGVLALACEIELTGQAQDELHDKVQEDLNECRLDRLKGQRNDIVDAIRAAFRRLRRRK